MKSSEGNLVYPNELNEEWYSFGGTIDADAAPTQPQQEVFKKLSSRLDEQLQKWAALKQQEVPKVNDMIKQADIPALTVSSCPSRNCKQAISAASGSNLAEKAGQAKRPPCNCARFGKRSPPSA